ncbi:MAG: Uroporphyrinogen synthase [Bacteroidota bacterium]|jgi:uroporphyrinogen-III synthase|nr:Uroporphyrinogen synthase [Bacteroidota bacterium]
MAIKKKKPVKTPARKTAAKSSAKKNNQAKRPVAKKSVKKITKKVLVKKVTKAVPAKKAAVKKAAKKVAAKKAAPKKILAKKPIAKSTPSVKKKPVSNPKTSLKKTVAPAQSSVAPKVTAKVKLESTEKATPVVSAEKFVKVGVKTKKQLVAVAPQPVIEVSNFPKHKVKTILISQPKPENDKNPYYDLAKKYNLIETFRQFIKIEGLPVKDFRAQRIDILEHKAVILTSRMAVDHYFRMCNEMRVTVPESMKYFCINEATAYYLQKYIQYRKRKIFFGHQTIQDLVDVIRKNREEKFLLPAADVHKEQICEFLDAIDIKYTKAVMYRTVSADLSDIKNLNEYDILAFFTPAGINSLKQNFPDFKQGNTRIACFGAATANTLKKHGYRLDIYAPNPKNPSMSGALDEYIREANKR